MSFVLFRSDLTTGSPSGAARVRLACSHRAGETGPRGTASRVGRWMRARSVMFVEADAPRIRCAEHGVVVAHGVAPGRLLVR